ncbi:hypothetical protein HN371_26325 [Candidatus Poribacteria bacterium]|jgi:hypothetical protein|nr:hypothetical protein [Candidatus Poribacteria bacterium]MBT5711244.1 hypothetical protein [Candidatus Poribacteria bacterium]MBT7098824.1 hypothetical protein [Candidatus Poribacteria bacterium]MBT7804615.1 hypothetical protein [Candidatus Poribacteria bacterium]
MPSGRRAISRPFFVLAAVAAMAALLGCGEDELRTGPPSIIQTRAATAADVSAAQPGDMVTLTVEAWVDDPNEDIASVTIDSATADLFAGGAQLTPPVDLMLQSEERSQGQDLLVSQHWSTEVAVAWTGEDVEFTITVADEEGQTAQKMERWSPTGAGDGGAYTAADYFPLTVGSTWDYEDRLSDLAHTVAVTEIHAEGTYDWSVIDEDGVPIRARYDVLGNVLRWYEIDTAEVFGEVALDPDRLVRRPWDTKGILVDVDGNARVASLYIQIESTSASVITPAGTFTCMKLQRSFDVAFDGDLVEMWYAPGVGVVRKRLLSATLEPYDYELVSYEIAD